jgi:hypothetical protein
MDHFLPRLALWRDFAWLVGGFCLRYGVGVVVLLLLLFHLAENAFDFQRKD